MRASDEMLSRLRSFARHFIPPNGEGAYYLSADDPLIENARLLLDVLDDYERLAALRAVQSRPIGQPETMHVL